VYSEIVKELLAFGADPYYLPPDMWKDYLQSPNLNQKNKADSGPPSAWWCTEHSFRERLAETLHLTHRYSLHRASKLSRTGTREIQIAKAHNMSDILKIPYFIIGQVQAAQLVKRKLMSHVAFQTKTPFTMAFCGPSGHGKTELAKQLGALLSIEATIVDCGQMKHDWDMFGARNGFIDSEKGSQVNNFLAEHDGQRCLVFLDEFDKCTQEIRNSLLLLLDEGAYWDRRRNMKIDASRAIFILCTNLGDKAIEAFYEQHMANKKEESRDDVPIGTLQAELRSVYTAKFGAPFTGRINLIAPFLPFTPNEQAIVAHKFMLQLSDNVRQPIDLAAKRLIGHCQLAMRNDGKISMEIAKTAYHAETGARSLYHAVNNTIRDLLFEEYCNDETPISKKINEGGLQRFVMQIVPIAGKKGLHEVKVVRDGFTVVPKKEGEKGQVVVSGVSAGGWQAVKSPPTADGFGGPASGFGVSFNGFGPS